MTTVQDILDAAYTKSTKNQPGKIATEATELLALVTRSLHGLYAAAARVNPIYFAKTAAVPFAGAGWARPTDAESVFRIENGDGQEVVVVPFDDQSAEPSMPAVYQMGRTFYPVQALAPEPGEVLTFYYAARPATPVALGSTLDPSWPEQFNELLALEIAIALAAKDGSRGEEVQFLQAERARWLALFVAFLEHGTANERRRIGSLRTFPINTLFAGGAATS